MIDVIILVVCMINQRTNWLLFYNNLGCCYFRNNFIDYLSCKFFSLFWLIHKILVFYHRLILKYGLLYILHIDIFWLEIWEFNFSSDFIRSILIYFNIYIYHARWGLLLFGGKACLNCFLTFSYPFQFKITLKKSKNTSPQPVHIFT